jgi:hypothetical protein
LVHEDGDGQKWIFLRPENLVGGKETYMGAIGTNHWDDVEERVRGIGATHPINSTCLEFDGQTDRAFGFYAVLLEPFG